MLPTQQGSFKLFRFAGIDVYLHWSWIIVAIYIINVRARMYSSPIWNILEYVGLFAIVLMHEFGHSLACRQVGGKADQIVMWPLGGVAYVAPPQRPGATLWSIVAGPLVNVMLIPVLTLLMSFAGAAGADNLHSFFRALWLVNLVVLVFNILPIYPLDGGQILRALLWFVMGRARSLMAAAVLGLAGVAGLFIVAFLMRHVWLGILGLFILFNCWSGLQQARLLTRLARLPRRREFKCPECHEPPIIGPWWRCPQCGNSFDVFETGSACPNCQRISPAIPCIECSAENPYGRWGNPSSPSSAPPPISGFAR